MSAETQRAVFVGHARSLLGARWRHRGRKPWALDCVGLLYLSGRAAGWPLEDRADYGREPWDDQLRKEMRRQLGLPLEKGIVWQSGDVPLIRWKKGEPCHVGIIADYVFGGLSMIHCENINGCVEHSFDEEYLNAIVEVYRPCAKFCP